MRKLSLIVAAGALLVPAISQAMPLNDLLVEKGVIASDAGTSGQVSYNKGTKLTFGNDFDMMLNLQIQTRLEHINIDKGKDTTDRGNISCKIERHYCRKEDKEGRSFVRQ